MANKGKSSDLSSSQQPGSKLDSEQTWAQLTAKYLHDLPEQLDGIRTVLEVKDYAAIRSRAHRIKGTSGTYRLDTISRSAAKLERLAEAKNPDAIAAAINDAVRLVELETNRLNLRAASLAESSERNTNG